MRRAKGTWLSSGNRKIAIVFERELFKRIAEEAVKNGITFAEQVRIYIEKGMKQ